MSWLLALVEVVVLAGALRWLPALHPAQLWSFSWAIAAVLFAMHLLPYKPLGTGAGTLAILATIAFVLGCLGGSRLIRQRRAVAAADTVQDIAKVSLVLGLLTVVGLFVFLFQVAQSFGVHAALLSSSKVRLAIAMGQMSMTIKYVYVAIACAVAFGTLAGRTSGRRARIALVLGSLAAATTYFNTGRVTLVTTFVALFVARACARPSLPRLRALIGGAAVLGVAALIVFVIVGSLIGKTYANSDLSTQPSVFRNHAALSDLALPYLYASAPIAGLDRQVAVSAALGETRGCATLAVVCKVLHTIGFGVRAEPLVRPFTAPPVAWNTYTALDLPILDIGPWLAWIVILLLGVLSGAAWERARSRQLIPVALYALLSVAILHSATQNDFLAPHLLGAFVIMGVVLVVVRLRPVVRLTGRAVGVLFPESG